MVVVGAIRFDWHVKGLAWNQFANSAFELMRHEEVRHDSIEKVGSEFEHAFYRLAGLQGSELIDIVALIQ